MGFGAIGSRQQRRTRSITSPANPDRSSGDRTAPPPRSGRRRLLRTPESEICNRAGKRGGLSPFF
uniref:Uncharacterized protein n=1 Tax=Arundo donax TaxID=35708 RepID=A0A0A9ELV6_ARUDO